MQKLITQACDYLESDSKAEVSGRQGSQQEQLLSLTRALLLLILKRKPSGWGIWLGG